MSGDCSRGNLYLYALKSIKNIDDVIRRNHPCENIDLDSTPGHGQNHSGGKGCHTISCKCLSASLSPWTKGKSFNFLLPFWGTSTPYVGVGEQVVLEVGGWLGTYGGTHLQYHCRCVGRILCWVMEVEVEVVWASQIVPGWLVGVRLYSSGYWWLAWSMGSRWSRWPGWPGWPKWPRWSGGLGGPWCGPGLAFQKKGSLSISG